MILAQTDLMQEDTYVAEAQLIFSTIAAATAFEVRTKNAKGRRFSSMRHEGSVVTTVTQTANSADDALQAMKKIREHISIEIASNTLTLVIVFRVFNVLYSVVGSREATSGRINSK